MCVTLEEIGIGGDKADFYLCCCRPNMCVLRSFAAQGCRELCWWVVYTQGTWNVSLFLGSRAGPTWGSSQLGGKPLFPDGMLEMNHPS